MTRLHLFRPRLALLAGVLACTLPAHAASIPDGWFVWPSIEPVAGSALDASALNPDGRAGLPRITARDGHFFTPDGKRIRFWGANLCAADAYPATAEQAGLIARRLAKGGVNLVRLHHLDNDWGTGIGGSIWRTKGGAHAEFDAVQLDRLHRLIAHLRNQGIYTNLNLKVAKSLTAADGFDPSIKQLPLFQKRADIFVRRMIDLQKDYARRMLTTKNPYTGLTPASDPAIAVIELNNENSLLGFWTKDLGQGLDKFPPVFRAELQGLWNQWLARRYADDQALAAAWAPAAASTPAGLVPASATWNLNTRTGATARLEPGADAGNLTMVVTAAGSADWHVQASIPGLRIADGEVYALEFEAKADRPRRLGVGVSVDAGARPQDPWRSFGLLDSAEVGADWTPVRFVFPAHGVGGAPGALQLNAGATPGRIMIRKLSLRAGAGSGLAAGQSPRAGTVALPASASARQWADWIHFLADTERAYAEEMRAWLKDELKVQAPIVCSQIDYGGLTGMNREQSMEVADAHAYWQHPDLPDNDWHSPDWSIKNTPQVADFGPRRFGQLGELALVRVHGKPYSISEYDHPAPSEFACEMYPELAAFASRQDWDAVYPFTIGAYGTNNPAGRIHDYFDQLNHPAKWGFAAFAPRVFRQALVPAAEAGALLRLGSPVWAEQPHADALWQQLQPDRDFDYLNRRYAVSDRPGAPGAAATLQLTPATTAPVPPPVQVIPSAAGPVFVVNTPQAAALTGYLGGGTQAAGALRVTCPPFGRNFASVTAIALDGRALAGSSRVLVTLAARATNQGIVWNQARTSLGKNQGHGPTIAERVPATITLAGAAGRQVFALAPDGQRAHAVTATAQDGALVFTVGPSDNTLHYEIVVP